MKARHRARELPQVPGGVHSERLPDGAVSGQGVGDVGACGEIPAAHVEVAQHSEQADLGLAEHEDERALGVAIRIDAVGLGLGRVIAQIEGVEDLMDLWRELATAPIKPA